MAATADGTVPVSRPPTGSFTHLLFRDIIYRRQHIIFRAITSRGGGFCITSSNSAIFNYILSSSTIPSLLPCPPLSSFITTCLVATPKCGYFYPPRNNEDMQCIQEYNNKFQIAANQRCETLTCRLKIELSLFRPITFSHFARGLCLIKNRVASAVKIIPRRAYAILFKTYLWFRSLLLGRLI